MSETLDLGRKQENSPVWSSGNPIPGLLHLADLFLVKIKEKKRKKEKKEKSQPKTGRTCSFENSLGGKLIQTLHLYTVLVNLLKSTSRSTNPYAGAEWR